MDFGQRLKYLRERARLSQEQLGRLTDREQQEISHLERNGRLLAKDVPMFARALRQPVTAFYADEDVAAVAAHAEAIDVEMQLLGTLLPDEARAALLHFIRMLVQQSVTDPDSLPRARVVAFY